jgi:hypothetical protein
MNKHAKGCGCARCTERRCPACGEDSLCWDEADVGVGVIRSPAWCGYQECGYDESNPYGCDDDHGYPPPHQRTNEMPTETAPLPKE